MIKLKGNAAPPIKVGILHSLSGTMAISEKSVVNSTLMAIEEINLAGGILGRKIEPIIVDTHSDDQHAAQLAERLITQDKVSVVFGCWTSSCRKTVKPVFEKYEHLLIYPVQYEGLESSPNIIYTGAAPNQQIIPAVKWLMDNVGKKFYLIGSDYIFPRIANHIVRKQVEALDGVIVGESYKLLGATDFKDVVEEIKKLNPDAIINTLNGSSNVSFFYELNQFNMGSKHIPAMSFSIAEDELRWMNVKEVVNHYAAWNYFQSIKNDKNIDFVNNYKKRYGDHLVTDDPMEAGYFGVYLWAQAVKDGNTDAAFDVVQNIKDQSRYAPEGNVYIDPRNNHTWKRVRIGKIKENGQFEVVWVSDRPIQPDPYPGFFTKEKWESLLHDYYQSWGKSWKNTSK